MNAQTATCTRCGGPLEPDDDHGYSVHRLERRCLSHALARAEAMKAIVAAVQTGDAPRYLNEDGKYLWQCAQAVGRGVLKAAKARAERLRALLVRVDEAALEHDSSCTIYQRTEADIDAGRWSCDCGTCTLEADISKALAADDESQEKGRQQPQDSLPAARAASATRPVPSGDERRDEMTSAGTSGAREPAPALGSVVNPAHAAAPSPLSSATAGEADVERSPHEERPSASDPGGPVSPAEAVCPECGGTGLPTGWIETFDGPRPETCPKCSGTGRRRGEKP